MKKYLIFLIIFLTSFFFVGNVKGATHYNVKASYTRTSYANSFNSNFNFNFKDLIIDITNLTDDEITEKYPIYVGSGNESNTYASQLISARNYAKTFINEHTDVTDYFLITSGYGSTDLLIYLGFYNSNDNAYLTSAFFSTSSQYFDLGFFSTDTIKYYGRYIYNKISDPYTDSPFQISSLSLFYYSSKNISKIYNKPIFIDISIPIIYNCDIDYKTSSSNNRLYYDVSFEDEELCYTLQTGDVFYKNGEFPFAKLDPSFGDIELIKNYTGNDIYSIQMKLPINNYDSNYIYQYKKSTDTEWADFSDYYVASDNSFEDVFYDNGSFYYRILDQENNVISTSNLTITSIVKSSPYLTFNVSTPDFCNLDIADEKYITCKNLDIITHNLSENNAVGYYSFDNENWTIFYSDTTLKIVNNGTLYFKVVNINDNNNILSTYTYLISGVDENITILDEYKIKFISNLASNKIYTNLSIIFYNVDQENRKYYISSTDDLQTWINVTSLLVDNDNYSKKYDLKLFNNGTIGAKVEDNSGNILSYSTITITKIENSSSISFNNIIASFKTGIFESFTNVYSLIRNNRLGNYTFIIITCSIIILLVKSMKR